MKAPVMSEAMERPTVASAMTEENSFIMILMLRSKADSNSRGGRKMWLSRLRRVKFFFLQRVSSVTFSAACCAKVAVKNLQNEMRIDFTVHADRLRELVTNSLDTLTQDILGKPCIRRDTARIGLSNILICQHKPTL